MNHFDDGIFLSSRTLASLPASLRAELFTSVFGGGLNIVPQPAPTLSVQHDVKDQIEAFPPFPDNIATIDIDQARSILAPPMNDKTRSFLRAVAMQPTHLFELADIATEIKQPVDSLSGVYGGITIRVRMVTNDKGIRLIDWYGQPRFDANNKLIGQLARLRPESHAALKAVLDAQDKMV